MKDKNRKTGRGRRGKVDSNTEGAPHPGARSRGATAISVARDLLAVVGVILTVAFLVDGPIPGSCVGSIYGAGASGSLSFCGMLWAPSWLLAAFGTGALVVGALALSRRLRGSEGGLSEVGA